MTARELKGMLGRRDLTAVRDDVMIPGVTSSVIAAKDQPGGPAAH